MILSLWALATENIFPFTLHLNPKNVRDRSRRAPPMLARHPIGARKARATPAIRRLFVMMMRAKSDRRVRRCHVEIVDCNAHEPLDERHHEGVERQVRKMIAALYARDRGIGPCRPVGACTQADFGATRLGKSIPWPRMSVHAGLAATFIDPAVSG
jgi:hypothetical protein